MVKWLDDDESIILEGKAFVWIKTPLTVNGTWALLYLTNKRFYVKDRIIRVKILDLKFSQITNLESDGKYLTVEGDIGDRSYLVKVRLKGIDDSWEWMLRQRSDK